MFSFEVTHASRRSRARLGRLHTAHGVIETPSLIPVATQAVVKTLTSEEAAAAGCQALIANTFHLHLRPGEDSVQAAGGLHQFMRWDSPLMTDSGGFQVFSLGFGRDLGVGKIGVSKTATSVRAGAQPTNVRITDEGVEFRSPIDGTKLFLGPRESMAIQEALGADIIFTFDECTPPNADREYTNRSLTRTHEWATLCLNAKTSRQALYGIVQGGKYDELRVASAQFLAALPFDGFGIGGEFGDDKASLPRMVQLVCQHLPPARPRHLLGIGHLEDIIPIIESGVDTFDCTVPTHYARRGVAFTSVGAIDLGKAGVREDDGPLDSSCSCPTCQQYTRRYLAHLYRAGEITALRLLTFHNLYFFNEFVAGVRKRIGSGEL